ncbi:hypothetical protein SAMN05661080_02594 [Modestobacter sp. DSM 44400]|uniref:hypothetical protein n=1 Tax=Modestobacter sp. DSM 44400 TaxID=1550230 RepID=UPI0008944CAE|nr:hypothetical protein [Modestobacter sp. DSM 44400]SDY18060.1 hypothetical protein SAMN05661080_02594 [Modestobacter sp. DSM 44400]
MPAPADGLTGLHCGASGGALRRSGTAVSEPPADRPGPQERLDALPLPVFFGAVAVVGGLAGAGVERATQGSVDLSALAVRVVLFAVVLTWLAARQRRRTSGAQESAAMGAAIRHGALPADADPAVWRPALERQRSASVRGRRVGPVVFGVLAVGSVVVAVLLSSHGWSLTAAGWAVLGALGPLGSARNLRRVDVLLEEPDRRPGPR